MSRQESQPGLLSTEAFGHNPIAAAPVELDLSLQDQARAKIYAYVTAKLEKTDTHVTFGVDDVYVVWFSKVLQNYKALLSTTLPDGMYYELTYNGDKRETYIDAYKKFDNICIPDED
jgi:hypothetical protein